MKIIANLVLAAIFATGLTTAVYGRSTQCLADLSQIVDKVTLDYAGYADKTRGQEKHFAGLTKQIRSRASKAKTFDECTGILQSWVNAFKDGHLFLLVKGTETVNVTDFSAQKESQKPSFRDLDGAVLITIPAFDLNYKPAIDDLLKAHAQEIGSSKLMILDLRGNKGGGDSAYAGLVPLIYTGPIKVIGTDIWASSGNIAFYKSLIENKTFPEGVKAQIRQIVAKMEEMPNHFVRRSEDDEIKLDHVTPFPQKIAILIDEHDGSTTEQFLLAAKQSRKVTVFGKTNSAGILDYANVTNTDLVSGKRILFVPSSRTRRLPANPVDGVGIAPDIKIPKSVTDEIGYVRDHIDQSSAARQ